MSRRVTKRACRIAIAIALCLAASEAWSDEAVSLEHQCLEDSSKLHGSYDLARLLDIAQCLNPETREAWEKTRQAELAVDLVHSSYRPQVSLEALGGFQRTPLPIPTNLIARGYFVSDTREFVPSLGMKWLLFDFGRRAGQEATARANQAAADGAYNGAQQRLVFSVTRAYFQYQSSREDLRAADQAVTAAQTIQDATDAQHRNGRATVVATAQAERQTALSKLNQVKANGAVRTAYASLLASIGLSADTQFTIGENADLAMPVLPGESIDHYVQQALAGRPDVHVAEERVKAAEGEVQSAHAAYHPTISFSGSYFQNIGSLSNDGGPYYSVNKPGGAVFLHFELPLFDGGSRSAHLSIAHSQVQEAQDQLDQVRDKVAQEVVKAYNDLRTSLEAYTEAQTFAHAARVAYEAALDAYQHGVGTYTDLANDEAIMAQSESTLASANADAQIARVALALAIGDVRVTP